MSSPAGPFVRHVLIIVLILGVALVASPPVSQAASEVPSIEITGLPDFTGCDNMTTPVNPAMPVYWNVLLGSSDHMSFVVDGVGEVASVSENALYDYMTAGDYGLAVPIYNVANGTQITITITTYYGLNETGGKAYESVIMYECGTATLIGITNTAYDPPVDDEPAAPLPGADLVPIPSTAVVGTFTADTPLYFDDSASSATSEVMQAGKTLWVLGLNAEGSFYKVLLSGKTYWVPVGTMGPTYDEVWNGTPLPTTAVQ